MKQFDTSAAAPVQPSCRWRVPAAALAALLLASCGGGDPVEAPQAEASDSQASDSRKRALAAFPSTPIPADAGTKGMWGPLAAWPLISVHAVLMPDGRVLSYGSRNDGLQTAYFEADLWDANAELAAGHQTFANSSQTDIFCGSQLLLPPQNASTTPSVFMAGGDNWTGTSTTNSGNNNSNVFSTGAGVVRGSNMNRARWYSTSTMLINGEVLIHGGSGGTDRPEVRGSTGSFRLLSGADTTGLHFMYPRNFVMPDGRLFGYDSNGAMYFVDAAGTGSLTRAGNFAGQYGSADASAAMFRPGRILQFGGNSNGAIVIDVGSGNPVVTPTQSMRSQRRLATATLLADGTVLATGGSPTWNSRTNAELAAEIWNPQSGQWTVGALAARARLYHSNALLLPDATVLVTGGGALGGATPKPADQELNAQIYYPPYLFTAAGQRAARPEISVAPNWLEIGKTFSITTAGSGTLARVALVKTGSATHNWNMEQRFMDLAFVANGNTLAVQAPARAGEATPGYYMLFVINTAGVPSNAHMVRVGVAANPNPATVPTLANPGNRSNNIGDTVSLALTATDPNGDTLRYSATGLPAGLQLNTSTGAITGNPTSGCSCNVVLAASDGINSATVNLVWTVNASGSLVLTTVPKPSASLAGGSVTFTAGATGTGVQYQWRFGDGTADTPWSAAGSVSHTYAQPGTYVVTLLVRDSAGNQQSRSFMQTVYLPATAAVPTSSSTLLWEQPASGNARLWVVNPDNDSVSVFDAVTRARLAEVAVGTSPRAIARAANGLLWVSNKRSASISVIDPATRTVTRTIALPRASQPHGLAMTPGGALAYVALEASGQLLRLDTASYAQTAALAVGPHVRGVAVAADGASIYVSRFITPALPGEGTATVSTPATSGGELLQVAASTMTLTRTVRLGHSELVDGEAQGRGIANYLGALAISPDGSQGYVPSKQDNVKRGTLRDGQALNFQSTVRAISSRVVLSGAGAHSEDLARRVDHDNASMASAATYDRRGSLLFVALETSREVAVVDAHSGLQLMRFDTGRAPQGLQLSADGLTLYVDNFMDRSVGVYNLRPLLQQGLYSVPLSATLSTVATDKLPANVRLGKQLFYDARDTRLARDRYMSCASCHNDGGHDGRTWDLSHAGEGLRNTTSLRGRASMGGGHGRLHWSANFDEVQDFEAQIRQLAGGTGLMNDTQFNTGTRNQPLGDAKAGLSADLDALAAYVASLKSFDPSPQRNTDGTLTPTAAAGKTLFLQQCLACHGSPAFSNSAGGTLHNVGTLKSSSGQRLYGVLQGIDVPTLRDAWATAPYLHDGSAATLAAAIGAHTNLSLTATQTTQLAAYVAQIGSEEVSAGGLRASYFNNRTLSGTPALTRDEAVDFNWGSGSPGTGVGSNNFSVRWTGKLVVPSTGAYQFQTESDDGVRLTVNGQRLVDNWTDHSPMLNTSGTVNLVAGQQVDVVMEYYENGGGAVARLRWQLPGAAGFVAIPAAQLVPAAAAAPVVTAYEAEAGTLGGGALVQNASNAVGGQLVGSINNVGAFTQVTVNNSRTTPVNATLVIRFANGYTSNRSLSLVVNGVWVQQLRFAPTGGWNTLADTAAITVPLNVGSNTIRLQRNSADVAAANIDRYAVTLP